MLRFLEEDHSAKGIYIYPTKVRCIDLSQVPNSSAMYQALAQVQKGALEQLLWSCPGLEGVNVNNEASTWGDYNLSYFIYRFRHMMATRQKKNAKVFTFAEVVTTKLY